MSNFLLSKYAGLSAESWKLVCGLYNSGFEFDVKRVFRNESSGALHALDANVRSWTDKNLAVSDARWTNLIDEVLVHDHWEVTIYPEYAIGTGDSAEAAFLDVHFNLQTQKAEVL